MRKLHPTTKAVGIMTRDSSGATKAYDEFAAKLQARMAKLDGLVEKYKKTLEENKDDPETRSAIEKMTNAANEITELSERLTDIEQQMIKGVEENTLDGDSIGGVLSRNDDLRKQMSALANARGAMQIDGVSVRNTVSVGGIATQGDIGNTNIQAANADPLTLVNMIDWVPITTSLVEYVRESATSFMADIVAEGALKPESSLTFGPASLKVDVVAHWLRVTNQLLSDAPALAAYIEGRMAYGVRLKIEYLIINGETDSFDGLLKAGNSLTITSADNAIDTISTAKAEAYKNFLPPETVIINPQDWAEIEQSKGTDGHYLFGSPGAAVQPVLWGLKVVQSPSMPVGKFWAGNLTMATTGYIREDMDVELSTEDGDNFRKNLVTIRAEMRAAFGVVMPDAAVTGDLVNVGPSE